MSLAGGARAPLPRRLALLGAGLVLVAVGVALTIRAEIGVAPYDVLTTGLVEQWFRARTRRRHGPSDRARARRSAYAPNDRPGSQEPDLEKAPGDMGMAVRSSVHPLRGLAVGLSIILLGATVGVLGAGTAGAQAVEGVDLQTSVSEPVVPVAGAPTYLGFSVSNFGTQVATNVVLELVLPLSATIDVRTGCTVATTATNTVVTCASPEVEPSSSYPFQGYLTFAEAGTYELVASASADQPDAEGDSTAARTVTVLVEDADLVGNSGTETGYAGQKMRIFQVFSNNGPTSAGLATVEGTFPAGATLVPGTFFFGGNENLADDQCTITATGYACGPLHSEGPFDMIESISYAVDLPQTTGTILASATITGRNDPNPANDTATTTIEVRAPAAELYVYLDEWVGPWYGVQTLATQIFFGNQGQTVAEDVTVTIEAPPGWTVDVPAEADPPGRACAATPDGATVTCTFDEIHPLDGELTVAPRLTSPAGPSATGTVTVTVATVTPETGDVPNVASFTAVHAETAPDPRITVTPATDLLDGQEVAVEVADFPPQATTILIQCVAGALSAADCDLATLRFLSTDNAGALAVTMAVDRLIITDGGPSDCAVDACSVVAASFDLGLTRSAAISFADEPLPPAPLRVTLDEPAFIDDGGRRATVPAILECDEEMQVSVRFDLGQVDAIGTVTGRATSFVTVPCTPGEPIPITSDLMYGFDPGAATIVIRANAGDERAAASGTIQLEPFSTVLAQLQARLADPNDTTVVAELLAALAFRLEYNPIFAHDFWVAILNA